MTARMPRVRARERDALRMIARRGADHATLRRRLGELRDLVVGAADFERKHRLEVFPLEQHAILESAGEARGGIEGGFDRHVVNLGLQDFF